MSSVTKSPFNRPTSVMSLLAEQFESSYIDHSKSQPIEFTSISNQHCSISSSAPTHRNSLPGIGYCCVAPTNEFIVTDECRALTESDMSSPQLPPKRLCHSSSNDGIARPVPIKINANSPFHNTKESPNQFGCTIRHSRMSCQRAFKTPQRNPCPLNIRPIISPHYKKSAFTPTRSLTSPQNTSSDYSISPDIESPVYRSASVTSSGFNECSQQSLLIDPNFSPDSNQTSTCATIVNTDTPDTSSRVFPRCHSQPCDAPVLRNLINHPITIDTEKLCTCHESSDHFATQIHTPMKRRYPSLRHMRSTSQSESTCVRNNDSPMHCHCNKPAPNSADTSPNAYGSGFTVPKRDSYFFGNSRNYLIILPRIASSPTPAPSTVSLQADSQIPADQSHRQRVGSNSSSLSTSTTTDANTPTVISNNLGTIQRLSLTDSGNFRRNSVEDIIMDDSSLQENRSTIVFKSDQQCNDPNRLFVSETGSLCTGWPELGNCVSSGTVVCTTSASSVSDQSDMTTKSYSTTSDGTSNISYSINSVSSRSEARDPDDPPEIGFCFSQLNSDATDLIMVAHDYDGHSSSFHEQLDLDQIELD